MKKTDIDYLNKSFHNLSAGHDDFMLASYLKDGIFVYKPLLKNFMMQRYMISIRIVEQGIKGIEFIIDMYNRAQKSFEKLGYTGETKFSSYMGEIFQRSITTNELQFTLLNFGPEVSLFTWND